MSWPDPSDYQSALQFPDRSLRDPALRACALPDRTAFDLPRPIAGANAHVYRLVAPDGSAHAVRAFLKDSPARFARYGALSRSLATWESAPYWFVPFEWRPDEIWAAGAWRPALVMDWIDGVDIGAFLEARLGAPAELRKLAEAWREVLRSLLTGRVAHGDLQRGNVFIEPKTGRIRLIDYDSLWAPSVESLPPELRLAEAGHPAFQHPLGALAGEGADRFPALVIYVALRVLTVAPEVWYRLDNGDNLLFRPEDFATPQTSRAFPLLKRALVRHAEELALVNRLETACRGPVEQVSSALGL
jgi:hypothetical protein